MRLLLDQHQSFNSVKSLTFTCLQSERVFLASSQMRSGPARNRHPLGLTASVSQCSTCLKEQRQAEPVTVPGTSPHVSSTFHGRGPWRPQPQAFGMTGLPDKGGGVGGGSRHPDWWRASWVGQGPARLSAEAGVLGKVAGGWQSCVMADSSFTPKIIVPLSDVAGRPWG